MRSTTDHLQARSVILGICAALACGAPDPDPQSSTSSGSSNTSSTDATSTEHGSLTSSPTSSEGSSTSVATTSEDSSTLGDSDDGTGPSPGTLCPESENFECSIPVDCTWEYSECGGLYSWVGPDGCPRIDCLETPCPNGMWCHRPNQDCGMCMEINITCSDLRHRDGLQCSCGGGDGSCAGSFCIGNDEYPPGSC
jgi:hypothetical protein